VGPPSPNVFFLKRGGVVKRKLPLKNKRGGVFPQHKGGPYNSSQKVLKPPEGPNPLQTKKGP